MATIVNTPGETRSDGSGTGVVVGILIVVLVVVLLLVFGLPYLRDRGAPAPTDTGGSASIDVNLPSGGTVPSGSGEPAGPAQ